MVLRTGPLIEGVVSPTASATTRKSALDAAATTDKAGAYQYAGTKTAFDAGANTQQAAGAGLLAGSLAGSGYSLPQFGTEYYNASLVASGYQQNADGTWTHQGTGKTVDQTGQYEVGGGSPNTGGDSPVTVDPNTGQPTGPEGPGGGLGDYSREAIEAQINALTAQYGLDLEGIAALGGEIGSQARFLLAQLQRDKGFAQEDLLGNLVGRGVFRSGITARDTGRLEGDFAAKRAQVEMNKGQQLRQLAERAGMAKIGLAQGKANVISQIDQANLPAEIRMALLNELNTLTPEQVQQALDATRKPLPELELTDEDLANRSTFAGGSSATSGYSPIKF